jgi:5-methyltetrahydropteroyltriglutamate--homocysteine methyltransferase
MQVEKLVYGIYPKTSELRLHISRWEKGTIPDATLNENIKNDKEMLYNTMVENGIEHTDPLFNWYDIFRPLSLLIDGIELGPLTRFKETNTFYRMPEIQDVTGISIDPADFSPLNENPPLPLYLKSRAYFNAFLPSPLSFFKMSNSRIKYNEFQEKIEKIYIKILKEFHITSLVLYDPLPYSSSDILDISLLDDFKVKIVTTGKLFNSNVIGKPYSIIADYSAENFKIAREHSTVPGLKLIDGYSTRMEDVAEINKKINALDSNKIIVSHSEYFDFLPRIIADKKLEIIAKIGE